MNGGRVRDAHRPDPKCLASTGELIDIERVTISSEGGRWKSTHRGNSLAAYPTWPVYCLDEALHPLPHLPPGQRFCALVKLNTIYFGLVCAHVAIVPGSAVRIWPVPTAMAMPDSPLQGLSRHADSVALVSTATALAALLGAGEAAEPARQA